MAWDIESGSVLHLGTKIYVQSSSGTQPPTSLCEGGTCIHTTVNPTSLCCALLYPLSRPPAYCSSWRLYLRTVFSLPFPCLEQIEEVEGKDVFCSVSVPEKKRVIDTVQRLPTTFYFYFYFHFPFSAHAALQPTRGRLETCLFVKGRKKGGGRVSDGPWRTFRLLRSGIEVPVQAVL